MATITSELEKAFTGVKAEFAYADLSARIPVFTVQVPTVDMLEQTWARIANRIASTYQPSSAEAEEFERWNTYIFFVSDDEVGPRTRGQIESNRFSARKIVVPNATSSASDIQSLINRYVTGADIVTQINEATDVAVPVEVKSARKTRKIAKTVENRATVVRRFNLREMVGTEFVVDRFGKNKGKLERLLERLEREFADEAE